MTCGKILILSPHQCTEIFDTLNSISGKTPGAAPP